MAQKKSNKTPAEKPETPVSVPDSLREEKVVNQAVKFEEEIFGPPFEVQIETDEHNEETIILSSHAKGQEKTVKLDGWALHKLYEKLHRTLKMKYKDLRSLPPQEKLPLLQKALNMRKHPLKILFAGKHAVSVVSPRHQQFDLRKVTEEIIKAAKETLGDVEIVKLGNHTLFRLPIKSKYISTWLRINPGNNIAKGPSAIRFSTTFRTEFDTVSGGKAPACLNWANVWTVPQQLFNVKVKRLRDLNAVIGKEKVKLLVGRTIHTKGNQIDIGEFKQYIKQLIKIEPAINKAIELALKTPLTLEEMKAILLAYHEKVKLPKYIMEKIMENVKEETVWGLSQAVSWVRTHEEYRGMDKKDREEIRNTRVLENIAGEILSIAPMIADLKNKVKQITPQVLGIKVPVKAGTP